MKKLVIFLILAMFFIVSCHSSKKAENDTDIVPDEDVISDEETDEPDEDENDEDNDGIETDDTNPCDLIENSDGKLKSQHDGAFKCGCLEGYFWANPGCKKTTYANICTGQTLCFDNLNADYDCPEPGEDFYGQDAQYAKLGYCTKSSFVIDRSVENEETVKDNNLKIEWIRKAAESEYTWEEAVKYCEDLEFGGHDDWRLPNPKEMLFSSLSITMQDTNKSFFWSGIADNQDSTSAWGLYNNGEDLTIRTLSKTSTESVRCVREEAPAEPLFKAFAIAGNKIVRDFDSGLAWTEKPERISSWKEALAYCENLYYAGTSDWRVPNIHELISLADHKRSNPATSFPYGFAVDLISSTTDPGAVYDKSFKYIAFDTGRNGTALKEKTYGINFYALCVRNEPCIENYWWNGVKCVEDSGCAGNPCKNDEHSNGFCTSVNLNGHSCGCVENYFWDGVKCSSPCDPNPCENDKKSTGECTAPTIDTHVCGCVGNHFWDGVKCTDPCDGVSCKNFAHTVGGCESVNAFTYKCSCAEGYYWWGKEKGCLGKNPDTANICTGQTKCYDKENETDCPAEGEDFFGQDAQYAELGYCVPHNFSIDDSVENEKTVIDNNTGLEWQQTFSSYSENYCEDLIYGGHDDWRLPTILELQTIVDNGKALPAIDTGYFPDTPSANFWTSSWSFSVSTAGGPHDSWNMDYTAMYWRVDFSIGMSWYSSSPMNVYVRCVRGERAAETAFDIFVGSNGKNADITFDSQGTLIWQAGTKSYGWQNALKYCENLKLGGLSDWRLPNKNELIKYFSPCGSYKVDYWTGYYLNYYPAEYQWSSTSLHNNPKEAWAVQYKDCLGGLHLDVHKDKTDAFHTRCVTDNPCSKGEIWNGETCAKTNPCEPNPCSDQSYSTKTCIISTKESTGYFCECSENAFWSSDEKRCIRTCGGTNPCIYYSNSDQKCYEDEKGEFYCGCKEPYYWNTENHKCSKKCETDPCADKENSDGHCSDDTEHGYVCGCIDGYLWLPFYDMCVENLCISDPCENIENSDGTCEINEYLGRECGCIEGYTWNFSDGECQ